ncbi:glycoside hydrolase family 88 protein [uncultured Chitinophaga sp.]|uniref:glycoside hydrolase family 88/105 protein n=1 Tax=uncultured Chitinophaga sp. TaxID=339340 RepID=UPI0025EF56E0|nr:glycoside hydrolase family 88 protein [uncultured Chitinophaga sp.]
MKRSGLTIALLAGILFTSSAQTSKLRKDAILKRLTSFADWQYNNLYGKVYPNKIDWIYAPFWDGITSLYKITRNDTYLQSMVQTGEEYSWKTMNDVFNADRLPIGRMYFDAAAFSGKKEYADKITWVLDMHMSRSAKADVKHKGNPYRYEWWTWCDALYMGPSTFVKAAQITGNPKYLDYMEKHWFKTSDYLYSKTDSLYYRDDNFFDKQSPNGNKVFWGRGNGWVIAGLAMVLNDLPKEYSNRAKFEQQFREMAYKMKSLQRKDGLWASNLLDPGTAPGESSATALITYALTWGVNNGLLDKATFGRPVETAWLRLVQNVNAEGKLGYVQKVSDAPGGAGPDDTQIYAAGAFIMAGCEIFRFAAK